MIDRLRPVRDRIFNHFWRTFRSHRPEIQDLEHDLLRRGKRWIHDHHAILDLTGPMTGTAVLQELFSALGYVYQGNGAIPEKQNIFTWLAPRENLQIAPAEASSQLVIADFDYSLCSPLLRSILRKYTAQAKPAPLEEVKELATRIEGGEIQLQDVLSKLVIDYLESQPWPKPSRRDFEIVLHENELIAWTLVFGRRVNHFTLAAHLLNEFNGLIDFNRYASDSLGFTFNEVGGGIKGSVATRLQQSSSLHFEEKVTIADFEVSLPGSFIEFVWRYPLRPEVAPTYWTDYFNGFISANANNVVESLIQRA